MHVSEIVRELSATNSRLEKEAILERNKDNQEFKTWLHACLEPRLNFYIKKIPAYAAGMNSSNSITETITLLTNVLSTRSITGNAAIQYLVDLLTRLNPDDAKLIECCINKNPGCNVSTSTANKIFGDQFITDVPYMRCSLLKDVDIDSIPWEDGVYSECLSGDWLIECADGTHRTIESIVRSKLNTEVKTFNFKTKTYENKPIVGWFDNGTTNENWFEIVYENNDGEVCVTKALTGNHVLFLLDGTEIRVDELTPGDYII